ncbi:phosphoribosyltransferase [Sinorhizobium terangae]|uniref:Phosphoribosyltransferase n=1 Tax=Sinorhizobium terangae TaxID=110322 RepID=A0A6N7LBG0_SINTE|nr:phosphoribosyltransferase [Sinorhizobium terangae]MBB4185542.1 putative phosphoribosyl transferase [Sinorhizobium terangae]MQX14245.1 phosphoribosyltransferase [Sinorhizobium terangae]WFU46387.1 phosphoribosyltransferase [Sinorhizobium terangae]
MPGESLPFADRVDAGRKLARAIEREDFADPVVMALPRGGVPVAFEVAAHLGAPLELLIVRKIGAPGHAEFGLGALVDGEVPQLVLNDEAMRLVHPPEAYIEAETERQRLELTRRRALYVGDRPRVSPKGRNVIVVDDGIATGGTAKAAIQALRKAGAAALMLAVPVAPPSAVSSLRREVDRIVCLSSPSPFHAVSIYYDDFEQTTDAEVVALMKEARGR